MIPLVTKADLNNYKYVADSVKNSTVWEQFVSEAQEFDIMPWLGDALMDEILIQAATDPVSISAANQALLDGGSYTYQTKTHRFQGLKACIIYYAFARFTNRTPYNYTATGIVIKDSDLSTPVSDKVVQRLETEARLMGEAIRDRVVLFLSRNYADYPLWESRGCVLPGRKVTFHTLGD